MDAVRGLIDVLKRRALEPGCTLGLFHLLIGRRVEKADGSLVCGGLSWRELAMWLKKARWPKDAVATLGVEMAGLPPRDRYQFWYAVISQAHVDSVEARRASDALALWLEPIGYRVT